MDLCNSIDLNPGRKAGIFNSKLFTWKHTNNNISDLKLLDFNLPPHIYPVSISRSNLVTHILLNSGKILELDDSGNLVNFDSHETSDEIVGISNGMVIYSDWFGLLVRNDITKMKLPFDGNKIKKVVSTNSGYYILTDIFGGELYLFKEPYGNENNYVIIEPGDEINENIVDMNEFISSPGSIGYGYIYDDVQITIALLKIKTGKNHRYVIKKIRNNGYVITENVQDLPLDFIIKSYIGIRIGFIIGYEDGRKKILFLKYTGDKLRAFIPNIDIDPYHIACSCSLIYFFTNDGVFYATYDAVYKNKIDAIELTEIIQFRGLYLGHSPRSIKNAKSKK